MLFLLVKREDLMARTKPATTNGQTQPMRVTTEQEAELALTEQRQRIGPAIRQLRQQQGHSLSDLAQQTGISVSYLSRLEKGIGFFVEAELDARHVDEQLVEELSHTPIPKRVWPVTQPATGCAASPGSSTRRE
jgi:DNA-binding transcriptional regulator YiaG